MTAQRARVQVFVSSVMRGFAPFREAARRAITASGCHPVLVEDFPADTRNSRSVCLDEVARSDVLVLIVGERGGSKGPAGKLIVQEEYEHALQHATRVLAFIQRGSHDEDAQNLISLVEDWVDGHFRASFTTDADLEAVVHNALGGLPETTGARKVSPHELLKHSTMSEDRHGTILRLALSPTFDKQIVRPSTLDSAEFHKVVYQVGFDADVFAHANSRALRVQADHLIIEESTSGTRSSDPSVLARVYESGVIVLDFNVTSNDGPFGFLTILEASLTNALRSGFIFTSAFYDHEAVDPFKSHDSFHYLIALGNLGMASIEQSIPRQGIARNIPHDPRPSTILPYNEPQTITRAQLNNPAHQVEDALALLKRKAQV